MAWCGLIRKVAITNLPPAYQCVQCCAGPHSLSCFFIFRALCRPCTPSGSAPAASSPPSDYKDPTLEQAPTPTRGPNVSEDEERTLATINTIHDDSHSGQPHMPTPTPYANIGLIDREPPPGVVDGKDEGVQMGVRPRAQLKAHMMREHRAATTTTTTGTMSRTSIKPAIYMCMGTAQAGPGKRRRNLERRTVGRVTTMRKDLRCSSSHCRRRGAQPWCFFHSHPSSTL